MLLCNLHIIGQDEPKDICISQDKIKVVTPHTVPADSTGNDLRLIFEEAIAFPGLINSHDHLDFNSFPELGNRIYNNYVEWGNDIHAHNKAIIDQVLKIPVNLRVAWGVYKNLLTGITTVVNHGYPLTIEEELVHVFQDYYYIHSIRLEKKWPWRINDPRKRSYPFVEIQLGQSGLDRP
jgi:cytosine/adenosine deaminase-related metal-dependent hydrolase